MISVFQCFLISLFAYFGHMAAPWLIGTVGGWYGISRPLVSGMIVGAILGDVPTGIMIGAAVQLVFILLVTPGTSVPIDLNAVAFIGITLGILTVQLGGSVEVGVVISAVFGGLGTVFYSCFQLKNESWNAKAADAIAMADTKRLFFVNWIGPQMITFLWRFVPTFICLFFGQTGVQIFIHYCPADGFVMKVFTVLGSLLPAVGIAMLLSMIIKKSFELIFFLFGFTLAAALGLNIVSITVIALMIVYLYYTLSDTGTKATEAEDDELEDL